MASPRRIRLRLARQWRWRPAATARAGTVRQPQRRRQRTATPRSLRPLQRGDRRSRVLDFATLLAASRRQRGPPERCRFQSCHFPHFDPVLVTDRAVRDPLVCAGLYRRHPARLALCARADPQRAPVGRAGAADGRRLRRFHAVGDARHHPRRPHRLCAVLQSRRISSSTRPRSLQLWKGGMSFHGGFLGCVLAVVLFARWRGIPILSLGDLTCAVGADRAVSRPARQFHQRRAVGPADRRALGDGVSGRRTAAAPPEPALRGRARRAGPAGRPAGCDARRAR